MPIYSKPPLDMLVDLINEANPGLVIPVTKTNVRPGTPTTFAGSGIVNSQVPLFAVSNGPFVGQKTLNYRRLDFATIFRSLPIVIWKYSSKPANQSPYSIFDLLADINAKYGLNLTQADVNDANLPVGNTAAVPAAGIPSGTLNSSVSVIAKSGSLGWQGTFTLYWAQAPQDISNLIATPSLANARVWPGNRDVVDGTKYVVDLDAYGYDFTDSLLAAATGLGYTSMGNWLSQGYITGLPFQQQANYAAHQNAVINALNQVSGKTYTLNADQTSAKSLYGVTCVSKVGLVPGTPDATYPELNNTIYNSALIIDVLPAHTWGVGRIIMHYNQ